VTICNPQYVILSPSCQVSTASAAHYRLLYSELLTDTGAVMCLHAVRPTTTTTTTTTTKYVLKAETLTGLHMQFAGKVPIGPVREINYSATFQENMVYMNWIELI
jgi:hypothetical protein